MADTEDTETLAEAFHDAYEAAAIEHGWATQERSRVPWADVPEANKATMRAAIRAVLASSWLLARDERIRAEAWEEGALWAAVECGVIREGEPWLSTGDNPHQKVEAR